MTGLIINYFLHSDAEGAEDEGTEEELLGVERFEGIQEKLIPGYNEEGHKGSITKFFEGHDDHRWLVKDLVHVSDTETSVYLEAWKNNRREEFLSQTQKSNRSVISKLQFGTLVEVEFGFIPDVKKLNGDVRSNKRYPDTIHKGEIHKRRLCVVVKADNQRVQVVPVTSKAPSSTGDLSVCQIGDTSLADLIGYNNPTIPSYAICRMLKTVALTRILPPLSLNQRGTRAAFRDNRYSKKLNKADKAAFKQALSHAVGLTDYSELKEKVSEYFQELQVAKPENANLADQVARLTREKADFEVMAKRYEALLEIMTDWRMGVGDTPETARAHIEAEVDAYAAILYGD